MISRILALIAACGALAHALAQAPSKQEHETEIESVRLLVQQDGENAYFHFSESVVLTATNMLLHCDSLEVYATRQAESDGDIGEFGAIREIVATGNVRIVQAERTATCDKAVVQPNEERIVLSGSPALVQQVGGTISSDQIVLNRADGRITFEGSPTRRIRLTGPAIGDLGFEQTTPVPVPVPIESAPSLDIINIEDATTQRQVDESEGESDPESESQSDNPDAP